MSRGAGDKPLVQPDGQIGWAILVAIATLMIIGVSSIYVTDTHYASGHDGPDNAAKQCVFALVSLVLAGVVFRVGYQRIARHAYLLLAIGVVALIPLVIARSLHTSFGGLTEPRNGAYRWIQLPGFQVQPSEFFKLAYVLALAWYLRYRDSYRRFGGLLIPFIASAIPLALILLQPDLGTVLLMAPVLFAMLFAAGARIRHLAIIVLVGAASVPLLWGQIKGYQRARVTAVLLQSDALRQAVIENPDRFAGLATKRQALEWAASSGYQLVHSKTAIGSGGIAGYGWGQGIYTNHSLLPDRHNDFIFSVIAHQWGIVGGLIVLACYVVIVLCGLRIASATTEPVGRLLAVGIVTLIALQVITNVGMAVGLMPITGMTLPFVSHGGSSLLTSFLSLALLVSVAHHRPFLLATKPFDFTPDPALRVPLTEGEDQDMSDPTSDPGASHGTRFVE